MLCPAATRWPVWRGDFPHQNHTPDGYERTSPVKAFPAMARGSKHELMQPRRREAFVPAGDAAGLLLGFNEEGKITGVALTAVPGD